jgi:predicted CoA-substrate-specific enzyme activase
MHRIKTSLGVCFGASTISLVRIDWPCASEDENAQPLIKSWRYPHDGNPRQTLIRAFSDNALDTVDRIAVTGKNFRQYLDLTSITTSEAIEYAYRFTRPSDLCCPAIVAAGGETFIAYQLDRTGKISTVITGNKCASGTGDFFLQQLRRMNVSLEEVRHEVTVTPFKLSGRCAVFCKSDCAHAIGKGIQKERVIAGLCQMMAEKILDLLRGVKKQNIMLTGGTAYNSMMVHYLTKKIDHLILPKSAACFEALGCALYAAEHDTLPHQGMKRLLLIPESSRLKRLSPFLEARHMVRFMPPNRADICDFDECILGLDVGSTTTKAALIRHSDERILESVYLRTNGNPIEAAQKCYQAIIDQIRIKSNSDTIRISGLGVCGSGRKIAGLHASSDSVINEITAHAAAAVFFEPTVDTLFEIGGQDAKYTHITEGVPSDYAMNEACSAGTGSFLEESAFETLGVQTEDIAGLATQAVSPANFNDQCAAFIAADIKNAVHEGIPHEDILAGLVYSICMNYLNRVKGNRPVGKTIFMQGGVCYNAAVPLAMAAILRKPIIIPPDPGLMGAFGVALVVSQKIKQKKIPVGNYNLNQLSNKSVSYGKSFLCPGERDRCDRGCEISVIEMEGKKYPFGGACDKYYNRSGESPYKLFPNYTHLRHQLVFDSSSPLLVDHRSKQHRKTVGINRSFLIHTYYPLISTFLREIGCSIELPATPNEMGMSQSEAAFCFPASLSQGFFQTLLQTQPPPDYIFLPHFKATPDLSNEGHSQLCPIVQGEPYYLKTTFREPLDMLCKKGTAVLTPILDMTKGIESLREPLLDTAKHMQITPKKADNAVTAALSAQRNCISKMKRLGDRYLDELQAVPNGIGIVLFGRPYNVFCPDAHKGIPEKFLSRGIPVVPFDCLPVEEESGKIGLFWGLAQHIYKGAQFVKKHPRLFAVLVTNFSCGPDSFLISYFRDVMGTKPSLTLELDSHTADAGIETRIEAFIDIISSIQRDNVSSAECNAPLRFPEAHIIKRKNRFKLLTASKTQIDLTDSNVEIIIPSMGKYGSEATAALLRGMGYNAHAHPPADNDILKLGQSHTLGKECLPLVLTTGMLLNTARIRPSKSQLVFFMPTASGPCRFGQYEIYMKDLIAKLKIPDVAIFSLSSEGSYSGFGGQIQKGFWRAMVIADAMEDIRSVILANAVNVDHALEIFHHQWQALLQAMESKDLNQLTTALNECTRVLSSISMNTPLYELPVISLVGEIFVRRDPLSRQFLTERLAKEGFAVRCSPVTEWLYYIDLMVTSGRLKKKLSIMELLEARYRKTYMVQNELFIQNLLHASGLYGAHPVDIHSVIDAAAPFLPLSLAGEGVLTVGSALKNIATQACGVIAIGPFGCMPNRIAEAILNKTMNRNEKLKTDPGNTALRTLLNGMDHLPFLAIETDGQPFSQTIETKLEAFLLAAKRLHQRMLDHSAQKTGRIPPVAFSA